MRTPEIDDAQNPASSEKQQVVDCVIKRFLSVLLPPFEFIQTGIKVKIGDEIFRAKGKVITSKGWKMVYDKVDDLEENSEEGALKEWRCAYVRRKEDEHRSFQGGSGGRPNHICG